MIKTIENSLIITFFGTIFVFLGILLIWGLMELLVKMTSSNNNSIDEEKIHQDSENKKFEALAAAVAVGLILEKTKRVSRTKKINYDLSPWQIAHRNLLPARRVKRGQK